MADFTTIADSQIEQDKPVTNPLLAALRDNPIAIAQGHDDAPRIKPVILRVEDQKSSGTGGGVHTNATFSARTLNTVVVNNIAGASLASNQVTLPAGTYDVIGSAPGFRCNNHKTALYNVTDAAYLLDGTSEYCDNGSTAQVATRSWVIGRFTIATAKVLELRHYFQTNGTGPHPAGNPVTSGRPEIYAQIQFTKVAP